MTDAAEVALAEAGSIYRRGDALVRVVEGAPLPKGLQRDPETPTIGVAQDATIAEALAAEVQWVGSKGHRAAPRGREGRAPRPARLVEEGEARRQRASAVRRGRLRVLSFRAGRPGGDRE